MNALRHSKHHHNIAC